MRFLSLRKMDRREKAQEQVLATLCWAEMEFGSDLMWKIQRTATFPEMVWGLLHSHLASSFMGLLGHLYMMSVTRLAQLPLEARGSFSANRENVLIKPLDRQPASTRGLLGKVAHSSLLGSLSWCGVATEGSFELIAILLPQPPECRDL